MLQTEQLIEELKDANRRKDEFLSMLADELRNPLAPIRNALHVLRLQGNSGGPADQARELAERQVERLTRMVDDLLELHGGTLRLPQKQELPALSASAASTRPPEGHLRVLIVEDNQDSAESLRMLLEVCGYEVALAATGPDGVAAAKAGRPDVVLCDIGLPGMDGFEVASTLRASPETAATRLIAVTGYGRDEDRQRALEAGFDAHLVKPVDPEKLLGHLRL